MSGAHRNQSLWQGWHGGLNRVSSNLPAPLLASLLLCACAQQAPAPQASGGLQDVIFDRYSPLSRNEEIARRTMTPLTWHRSQQVLSSRGQGFRDQPIDLTKERFVVYVPSG